MFPARLRRSAAWSARSPEREQAVHREQQPRRAEAALDGRVLGERLLEPRELGQLGEPLDRQHLAAVGVGRERAARAHRQAVEQHRARAAHLHLAGALRAGQPLVLAQEVEQQPVRLDRRARAGAPFSVNEISI